jgi:hypothetical protein
MSNLTDERKAFWKKFFDDHFRTKRAVQEYCGNPVDDPKNKEFMEEACDAWEAGNNADPIMPEDCDVDEVPFENHK